MGKGNNDNLKSVLKTYFNKKDAFLLPNILCYIRVLLMILFSVVYVLEPVIRNNKYASVYIAIAIMAVAEYTDFLDGFIARKFDQQSQLGKALDPICDKLSLLCIGIALVIKFHSYVLVDIAIGIFLIKELWLILSVIILARRNITYIQAKWYGKVATFLSYISFGLILLIGPIVIETYNQLEQVIKGELFVNILSIVVITVLSFAAICYTIYFIKLLKKGEKNYD